MCCAGCGDRRAVKDKLRKPVPEGTCGKASSDLQAGCIPGFPARCLRNVFVCGNVSLEESAV